MKIQKKWLSTTVSFLIVIFVIALTFIVKAPTSSLYTHDLTIGTVKEQVAFAVTSDEQRQGLSGTKLLADNNGMLFFFKQPDTPMFWMKNMNYPIDIIWIGSDKTVKDITANLNPSTYPKTFSPKQPIQYVLEVPVGFAEKNNVVVGTTVSF